MPLDGAQNYFYPPGTRGIEDTTIESNKYNTFLDDLVGTDLNIARPITRGGTGATTAAQALINLEGEKTQQVVTNYDSMVWVSGSFYSSNVLGQAAPVDGHRFLGYVSVQDVSNIEVDAYDLDSTPTVGVHYKRTKTNGVWTAWLEQVGSVADFIAVGDARYVNVNGDTMTGNLTIVRDSPQFVLNNTSTNYTYLLFSRNGSLRWDIASVPNDDQFTIDRFNDAGARIDAPLVISRSTGLATVLGNATTALGIVPKQQMDAADTINANAAANALALANTANTNAASANSNANNRVLKSGDTMSGRLTLSGSDYKLDIMSAVGHHKLVNTDSAGTLQVVDHAGNNVIFQLFDNGNITCHNHFTMLGTYNKIQSTGDWAGYTIYNLSYGVCFGWFGIANTLYFGQADGNGAATGSWRFNISPNSCELYGAGGAWKPGGGMWDSTSDARIKNVKSEYKNGLASIISLNPVRYTYKGNEVPARAPDLPSDADGKAQRDNETAPFKRSSNFQAASEGKEFIGLIAQECEDAFPEIVSRQAGTIDGAPVTDLRSIDPGPLLFALINAVKELSAKVAALEAQP